jgi:uncharacterized protein (TIGR00288 family)
MENDVTFDKIAVLIDADNARLKALKSILDEISKFGRIIVKKAYGDWKNPSLKRWEAELKQLAIKPEHQFAYTKRKNITDIALVIDAMDLLYRHNHDAFVIVSSDVDYTPLAIRLRETGAYIFGVGEEKTPIAFRNSCDSFIFTEHIMAEPEVIEEDVSNDGPEEEADTDEICSGACETEEIHRLLKTASETYQDDDGWVNAAIAGDYVKRARPDFELRAHGFSKLSDFLNKYHDLYETKRHLNERGTLFSYKLK